MFGLETQGCGEVFEAADREAMTRVIRQLPKPCVAFKVLGSGLHCQSAEAIEAALHFAFKSIRPADAALLGTRPKREDQATQDTVLARKVPRVG